jgi:2-hydroxychromene-2-carboxylate isomerase
MIKDCKLWAEKYKITFKFNNYFPINTLNLMRCVLVAEKKDIAPNFIDKVFDVIWKDGLNLNDNIIVEKLLKNLDLNPKTFLMEALNPVIKDELKRRTYEAYSKGILEHLLL